MTSRIFRVGAAALMLAMAFGCGGGSSSSFQPAPAPQQPAPLAVSPSGASIRVGTTQQFTTTGGSGGTVSWAVNNIAGGNSTLGTINASGLYTAPASLPASTSITITATASAQTATASASLLNPMPVVAAADPLWIPSGTFTLTITGTGFVPGSRVSLDGVPLTTTYVASTILTASGNATGTSPANATLQVANPDPGAVTSAAVTVQTGGTAKVSYDAAVRFLEQSTFGPTSALIAHVQQVGFDAFLDEQFAAAPSAWTDQTATDLRPVQVQFFANALTGQDQLRQRVAFALEQIWVISGLKIKTAQGFVPWLRMMRTDAFANYRTIMKDVTLSPQMGHYLDMVNNDKPDPAAGTNPNENYARELMQLFTIGLFELNRDGSRQLDAQNQPINTYDQDVVEDLAHLLTGWTYPTRSGATLQRHNPEYYVGPMVVFESNHYTGGKVLLDGFVVPAGQTAARDLDDAMDNIFNHPNVGPFIGKQLIQHLVKSNPSPQYVARVTAVFNDNGSGVRGDMRAVIKAILLDSEARAGDSAPASAADGHLREPVLFITSLLRALAATSDGSALVGQGSQMGQNILFPPSVFNYFPPDHALSNGMLAPEFGLQTPATSVLRANFVYTLLYGSFTGTSVDLSRWAALAADPDKLIDSINHLFLHGQMSSSTRDSIRTAVLAVPAGQLTNRARQALYLVATSSQYQVEQ